MGRTEVSQIGNQVESSLCKVGEMRFRINFSRIFAKNGRKLMGRKEDIASGGLLGLGTIIIFLHRRVPTEPAVSLAMFG